MIGVKYFSTNFAFSIRRVQVDFEYLKSEFEYL